MYATCMFAWNLIKISWYKGAKFMSVISVFISIEYNPPHHNFLMLLTNILAQWSWMVLVHEPRTVFSWKKKKSRTTLEILKMTIFASLSLFFFFLGSLLWQEWYFTNMNLLQEKQIYEWVSSFRDWKAIKMAPN